MFCSDNCGLNITKNLPGNCVISVYCGRCDSDYPCLDTGTLYNACTVQAPPSWYRVPSLTVMFTAWLLVLGFCWGQRKTETIRTLILVHEDFAQIFCLFIILCNVILYVFRNVFHLNKNFIYIYICLYNHDTSFILSS